MIRAVLDANVVISAVIAPSGHPRRIFDAWRENHFILVTSESLIAEVASKIRHPRIKGKNHFTEENITSILALLRSQGAVAEGRAKVTPPGIHPKDYKVFAAALEGRAEYIVSGERALLELREYSSIKVLSPAAFAQILAS